MLNTSGFKYVNLNEASPKIYTYTQIFVTGQKIVVIMQYIINTRVKKSEIIRNNRNKIYSTKIIELNFGIISSHHGSTSLKVIILKN